MFPESTHGAENHMMTDLPTALSRLAETGVEIPGDAADRLHEHMGLIKQWNRAVSLVSRSDLEDLESRHVIDSLSLAPILAGRGLSEGVLLDVGSGAGFPAIPLAVVLPGLRVVLVERSDRKVGFLRKVVGALRIERARIYCGQFPKAVADVRPGAVTARAVERPDLIIEKVGDFVARGALFLCQAGDPRAIAPAMFHVEHAPERFHVEHWEDDWTRDGSRRGSLYLVSPVNPIPSTPSASRPE